MSNNKCARRPHLPRPIHRAAGAWAVTARHSRALGASTPWRLWRAAFGGSTTAAILVISSSGASTSAAGRCSTRRHEIAENPMQWVPIPQTLGRSRSVAVKVSSCSGTACHEPVSSAGRWMTTALPGANAQRWESSVLPVWAGGRLHESANGGSQMRNSPVRCLTVRPLWCKPTGRI